MFKIWKNLGETPLEALERCRVERGVAADVPMTYAGRLDPMAEGELLVLVGDECRCKADFLGLDKEYEVEIVFGVSTDSYDALGLVTIGNIEKLKDWNIERLDPIKYVGKLTQPYPPYSSKAVNGEQLHTLAREGRLPQEMPTKEVEIYSMEKFSESTITAGELKKRIFDIIDRVKGDFRQEAIKQRWDEILSQSFNKSLPREFPVVTIRVKCSSGTYMRALADRMGKDAGTSAFALSIKRTNICLK
ncbi:MAG: hypothetical protein KGI49_00920 [Patescibacteria group bacterium]|nr:hypothetical protein [Patescibacteria group bacterium]